MDILSDVVKTVVCKGMTISILETTEEKTNQSSSWQFQCSACNDKQQFYTSGKHKIFYFYTSVLKLGYNILLIKFLIYKIEYVFKYLKN